MCNDDPNLQVEKKIEEIKIIHDAEDVASGINVSKVLGRPQELDTKTREGTALQADKKWVKNAMENLVKKVEQRQNDEGVNDLNVHVPANTALIEKEDDNNELSELKKSIVTEEQVMKQESKQLKLDPQFDLVNKLFTAEELTPFNGTKEMAEVVKNSEAIKTMLTNTMPPVTAKTAREEIDSSCIVVAMLYNRLTDSIDKLAEKSKDSNPDCFAMLQGISEELKKESTCFKEKTLEYFDIVSKDPQLINKNHTWIDALKFNRGVFYDLDNDKNIKYKIEGGAASKVYMITKTVPETETNKARTEVVFFRQKDNVPAEKNNEFVEQVISRHALSKETAASISKFLTKITDANRAKVKFYEKIRKMKEAKETPEKICRTMLDEIEFLFRVKTNVSKSEYRELGDVFMDWRDSLAKRSMAHDMSKSAKIDCGRNLSDRNVTTSRMAALLGIQDMVCDSRTATMLINGKLVEGNIMENTGGEEVGDMPTAYTPKMVAQHFEMQIFDFICGQVDRHFGNFHVIKKDGKYGQIRCLDNDMSFGKLKLKDVEGKIHNRLCPVYDVALMGLPTSFANRVMALSKPYIEQVMGDILNAEEIDVLMERLDYVKTYIRNTASKNPNMNWDEDAKKVSYNGEYANDEQRALWAMNKTVEVAAKQPNLTLDDISRFIKENVEKTNKAYKRTIK